MKVDWANKWISIPYFNKCVVLQGMLPDCLEGTLVQIYMMDPKEPPDQSAALQTHVWPDYIQHIVHQFQSVFVPPKGLPPSRFCDHKIPLIEGAKPVSVRPYRYPPALKDEIDKQIAEMLEQGVIKKSNSPFSSPVLLVKKKDKTWRFCVDYRYLSAITQKCKYPVPIFDELMDELAGAKWFSRLDLASGYHQILLAPGESFKTAFQTHQGHYEFLVMAFGLTGAPATFLEAMNETLAPLLRKCVLVFFDDILIYSDNLEHHLEHIQQVLTLLIRDCWQVKLSKCVFAKNSISYLGHIIGADSIAIDPSKIVAIQSWPSPSSVKELRNFLGLAGYYRRFVRHFGVISRPLTDLLRKNTLFVWTPDHESAFQALKTALVSAPVLALPDLSKEFAIQTDASAPGVGAVLLLDKHPIAFLSKALGPKNQGLSTYEKGVYGSSTSYQSVAFLFAAG